MFKKLIYISSTILILVSCSKSDDFNRFKGSKDDLEITSLSNISNLTAEERINSVLLKWEVPSDSSFSYVKVTYQKEEENYSKLASKYVDSLLIEELSPEKSYIFKVHTVWETPDHKEEGETKTIDSISPLPEP